MADADARAAAKLSPARSPGQYDAHRWATEQMLRQIRQGGYLAQNADGVTLFGEFGLRRQVDGRILAFERTDWSASRTLDHLLVNELGDWIKSVFWLRLQLHAVALYREATGLPFELADLHRACGWGSRQSPWLHARLQSAAKDCKAAFLACFDAGTLAQARRMTGSANVRIAAYNTLVGRLPVWRLLEKDAPALVPAVQRAVETGLIPFDENAFRHLKAWTAAAGFPPAAWRTLCQLPVKEVRRMLQEASLWTLLEESARVASCGGPVPPAELLRRSRELRLGSGAGGLRASGWRGGARTIPAWYDAMAGVEAQARRKAGTLADFVARDYVDALDWLDAEMAPPREPDANQRAGGWAWIARRSARWHEAQARGAVAENRTWRSLVDAYHDGPYEIVPLVTSHALAFEGVAMRHCVKTYDVVCAQGGSRIFSVRRAGKPLATVQIVFAASGWRVQQNRGLGNAQPDAELIQVGQRIAERYQAAQARLRHGQGEDA